MTNKKNKNGKMTLDKLARMVAEGFDKTATKEDLREVKDKLAEHDRRFSKLEFQVDEIHEILDRFEENDILDLQKRIKILERTVKAIAQHLNK
ncbi:MAG: hypothetical protein HY505_02230 [Candidatus Yanofskybacteria bacterium]|nr:hypothetical protein [Candidatus Yanofskybacteria bacterium]